MCKKCGKITVSLTVETSPMSNIFRLSMAKPPIGAKKGKKLYARYERLDDMNLIQSPELYFCPDCDEQITKLKCESDAISYLKKQLKELNAINDNNESAIDDNNESPYGKEVKQ